MTKTSSSHAAEMARPGQPFATQSGPMIDALLHGSEAYAKAALAWQQEVLRFMGSRLQWDGRAGEALGKCRTLTEVAEVQRDWAMSAAQDYFEEANRLIQLAAKLVPSWMPSPVHRDGTPPGFARGRVSHSLQSLNEGVAGGYKR